MENGSLKRKYDGKGDGPHKSAKMGGKPGGGSKFAQAMMAKMGWQAGQGLGREGEGIVNPIEVKLRPQGAGVGAVKEKTQQHKDEERRRAEKRGEEYEDSSEEERKARRERRKRTQQKGVGGTSGSSTSGGPKKTKTKFRTLEDVQAAAPGLDVPPTMLSSIIDATGSQTKTLTSAAGLLSSSMVTAAESEAEKVAKRERLELEAFIDAWHGIQEQKIYIEEHEGQHQVELEQVREQVEELQSIVAAVEKLKITPGQGDVTSQWDQLIRDIESLQDEHKDHIGRYGLSDAAVGAIAPVFKRKMADWKPLGEPHLLVNDLGRIRRMLGLDAGQQVSTRDRGQDLDEAYASSNRQKATTAYETLMYRIWLPKMQTEVTNWAEHEGVLNYSPLIAVAQAWRPLLPAFVFSHFMDELVVPKLIKGLEKWDLTKRNRHTKPTLKYAEPHTWIFPWLPYLSPYQLDPETSNGLLAHVKSNIRRVIRGWDLSLGVVPGLQHWKEFLRSEFEQIMLKPVMELLARYLSRHFEVDPADQQMEPLETVFKWQDHLKPVSMARLMLHEFFPKWLTTLRDWLIADGMKWDEVGEWFAWWKQQFPPQISNHPDVIEGWEKGRKMIDSALDLFEKGQPLTNLAAPAAGPQQDPAKEAKRKLAAQKSEPSRPQQQLDAVDFKSAVEEWCAAEDLLMVPLREAERQTGLPLYRITASAMGTGGVKVYLQGDIVWAQSKKDRSTYEPVGLGDALLSRAENK